MKNYNSGTCIAAIKTNNGTVVMGGDRRISVDNFYFESPVPKVIKKSNNILIGGCGNFALLTLFVHVFNPPKLDLENVMEYMTLRFARNLESLLKSVPGMIDEFKLVKLGEEESCSLLVVCKNLLFSIDIGTTEKKDETEVYPRYTVVPLPFPSALGSGADYLYPLLLEEYKDLGYNTVSRLKSALETVSQVDCFVDNKIDLIKCPKLF